MKRYKLGTQVWTPAFDKDRSSFGIGTITKINKEEDYNEQTYYVNFTKRHKADVEGYLMYHNELAPITSLSVEEWLK